MLVFSVYEYLKTADKNQIVDVLKELERGWPQKLEGLTKQQCEERGYTLSDEYFIGDTVRIPYDSDTPMVFSTKKMLENPDMENTLKSGWPREMEGRTLLDLFTTTKYVVTKYWVVPQEDYEPYDFGKPVSKLKLSMEEVKGALNMRFVRDIDTDISKIATDIAGRIYEGVLERMVDMIENGDNEPLADSVLDNIDLSSLEEEMAQKLMDDFEDQIMDALAERVAESEELDEEIYKELKYKFDREEF